MRLHLVALLAVGSLSVLDAQAEVFIVMKEQRAWMCQDRKTCKIADIKEAGTSPGGHRLGVAEIHLGIEDRPDFAPDEGCISADFQSRDGGIEYWLVDGSQPRRILQLCNDGYGAAGVGEDQVVIGDNKIVHIQSGGSAWRWSETTTMTLVPLLVIHTRGCSFHTLSPGNGMVVDIDRTVWQIRSLGIHVNRGSGEADLGCPEWTDEIADTFSPTPAGGIVGGFNVLRRVSNYGSDGPGLAHGQVLGDCALLLNSDATAGFLTYGEPATSADAARISVLTDSDQTLVIQVFDPTVDQEMAKGSAVSWVHRPHAEVWIAPEWDGVGGNPPPENLLQQIGVEWDGRVHHGFGQERPMPAVERWEGLDTSGRKVVVLRLTWPDSIAMGHRIGVAYSQSDHGRQARLVANTGILKNRPLFLPEIIPTSALTDDDKGSACVVRDGVLVRGSQP